jgi:nucleotide-binding universal stress UspA family protein
MQQDGCTWRAWIVGDVRVEVAMSFRPRHILVPVAVAPGDDVTLAEQLVDAACDIARSQPAASEALPARITLLYVNVGRGVATGVDGGFAPPSYYEAMAKLSEGGRSAAVEALAKLKARAERAGIAKDTVATQIVDPVEGSGEAIAHAARDLGADLIAMLSHGRKGLKRLFLGSVAERVAHVAAVPVLILRPGV